MPARGGRNRLDEKRLKKFASLVRIQPAPRRSRVWRAIMSSSLVGMTQTAARPDRVLMRGPPAVLASASSSIPSQAAVHEEVALPR
jgi:hypothetical protein